MIRTLIGEQRGKVPGAKHTPALVAVFVDVDCVTVRYPAYGTPEPEFTINLAERCADIDALRWSFLSVDLPDWLSVDEYIRYHVAWEFGWAQGIRKAWAEGWQRDVLALEGPCRVAAADLINSRPDRSAFHGRMRQRLATYLNTPPKDRKWDSPFGGRQWARLIDGRIRRMARTMAESTYNELTR